MLIQFAGAKPYWFAPQTDKFEIGNVAAPPNSFVCVVGHFRILGPLAVYSESDIEEPCSTQPHPAEASARGRPKVDRTQLDNASNRLLLYEFS